MPLRLVEDVARILRAANNRAVRDARRPKGGGCSALASGSLTSATNKRQPRSSSLSLMAACPARIACQSIIRESCRPHRLAGTA
jgi:hypothetical protein